uniref:Uncharacterized protein n=1 Tax=Anguilla anguilla TaxID=7936 RepID=A0A0E9WY58_ANGAN
MSTFQLTSILVDQEDLHTFNILSSQCLNSCTFVCVTDIL